MDAARREGSCGPWPVTGPTRQLWDNQQHSMQSGRRPEALPIWPSVARLIATLTIFIFHYLGLVGARQYRLALWALLTFAFLSGYLAAVNGRSRLRWAVRRYFSVMVPHWVVIAPVLIANAMVQYKPVTPAEAVVTVLGGNLFLENGLYVITWYVTFVLLLYAYLLADSFLASWMRFVLAAAAYPLFAVWLPCREYYLAFLIGLFASAVTPPRLAANRPAWLQGVARTAFRLQDFCYPFFLVHGAVLLATFRVGGRNTWLTFVVAFVSSVVAAYAVDLITHPALGAIFRWVDRHTPAAEPPAIYATARN